MEYLLLHVVMLRHQQVALSLLHRALRKAGRSEETAEAPLERAARAEAAVCCRRLNERAARSARGRPGKN